MFHVVSFTIYYTFTHKEVSFLFKTFSFSHSHTFFSKLYYILTLYIYICICTLVYLDLQRFSIIIDVLSIFYCSRISCPKFRMSRDVRQKSFKLHAFFLSPSSKTSPIFFIIGKKLEVNLQFCTKFHAIYFVDLKKRT